MEKITIKYTYFVTYQNTERTGSTEVVSNTKIDSVEKIRQIEAELSEKHNQTTCITNFMLLKRTYAK